MHQNHRIGTKLNICDQVLEIDHELESLKSTFRLCVKVTLMQYPELRIKYLTIDGEICFHRCLVANAVKPQGYIS